MPTGLSAEERPGLVGLQPWAGVGGTSTTSPSPSQPTWARQGRYRDSQTSSWLFLDKV